jgi:dephospho-CoA kinase
MPFPDEPGRVAIISYQPGWPDDFSHLARVLAQALGSLALAIDHVGSTSVPGLAAKDVIDVQVRVAAVAEQEIVPAMTAIGFRCRPEPWNRTETSSGVRSVKLVFAPPAGARLCNVHIRRADGPNARFALLFRDYLRADDAAREGWGAFKLRLAHSVSGLADYGQIKAPATDILIRGAECWAARTGWSVPAVPSS